MASQSSVRERLNTRWGRVLIENLTAYLFIFPALLIIFTFGLFPVAFAFFVSLHHWRRFPGDYAGLENYYDALGGLAYVLFFWIALLLFGYALWLLYRVWQKLGGWSRAWLLALPALLNAAAVVLFITWFFRLLPLVLDVPQRLPRREARNRELFIDEFFNSFSFPHVQELVNPMLLALGLGLAFSMVALRLLRHRQGLDILLRLTVIGVFGVGGAWLLQLTANEIEMVVEAARAAGEDLPIWSYIIFISGGVLGLVGAFLLWQQGVRQDSDRQFMFYLGAALLLMVGAYVLMAQLPQALRHADDNLMQSFWVTVLYVIGTVPAQLAIGLGLAYLLFNLQMGKSFFRVMYFLPYITPFAATAVVFSTLFSSRPESPANRFLHLFGGESQNWVTEPKPVFEIMFNRDLPQLLEGPGLALLVIILWSIWTYIGFDIVIFMAGLGNISREYYEAAQIDGASGWRIFRHITLPLLSPTTFFLSLVAIIGTFQAFTQVWMLRRQGAYDAVDTVGVYMYNTISSANPQNGYGAAIAFVLFAVIIVITLIQNRALGRKVFYG